MEKIRAYSSVTVSDIKDGDTYYTWIKYADTPTSGMSDSPDGKNYIGIAVNKENPEPSNNYLDYEWSVIKGDTGIGIDSVVEEFAVSNSATNAPSSGWSINQPELKDGEYLWKRLRVKYTDGSEKTTEEKCDTLSVKIITVTETIEGVKNFVNYEENKVISEIWQTDISTSINQYNDGQVEKLEEIHDRITSTEETINGITNRVSDAESKLLEKADGSTVKELSEKVSEVEQNAEEFKTTVRETYSTKNEIQEAVDNIKIGATNLIRNAETLIFNDYYFTSISYDNGTVFLLNKADVIYENENVTLTGIDVEYDNQGNVTII